MNQNEKAPLKPIVYVGIVNNDRLLVVDYKEAPNPSKKGWWIPAPGLEYGEDPTEKAEQVARDMGLEIQSLKCVGVESFVLPGGWHLITHFIIKTSSQGVQHPNVASSKWVNAAELSEMGDLAHGKWEKNVGLRYLACDPSRLDPKSPKSQG